MPRTKAIANKEELKIEYVPLEQVKRWPRNPKNHDLDTLEKSIIRFGFVQPVIVDGKSKKLVAGHGRLEALLRLKERGDEPPERIRVDEKNGAWMIPVLSGVKFASEADAEAYLIADNRIAELGGWDTNLLTDMLKEMTSDKSKLIGIGYNREDVDVLLAKLNNDVKDAGVNFNAEYQFRIEIDCENEQQQRAFLNRFELEGLKCRALIL